MDLLIEVVELLYVVNKDGYLFLLSDIFDRITQNLVVLPFSCVSEIELDSLELSTISVVLQLLSKQIKLVGIFIQKDEIEALSLEFLGELSTKRIGCP